MDMTANATQTQTSKSLEASKLRVLLTTTTWTPNTVISFAEEQNFKIATKRWNTYRAPTYNASITVGEEEDVVNAIKHATSANIPFLATSSRHGYGATLGGLSGGLAIDLRLLDTIAIDAEAATLTVGPGALNRDVLSRVQDAGFQIQTGSCSTVSLIAATLGGGVGRWSGVYGLIIDALISVRLVTANGEVIDVSENSHAELFWALRGAGANFGVITSATYKLQSSLNSGEVLSVDAMMSIDMAQAYFELLEKYSVNGLPAELAITTAVLFDPARDSTMIAVNWLYLGAVGDGKKLVTPLLELKPHGLEMNVIQWNEVTEKALFGADAAICQRSGIHSTFSANVKQIVAATNILTVEKMDKFYRQYPGGRASVLLLETFPNKAALSIPDDATAYPWRDAKGNFIFEFSWSEGDLVTQDAATSLGQNLRVSYAATSGYDDLSVYVNYAVGDEPLDQIYGQRKIKQLACLKKKWDPRNVFAFHHSLSTA